jgi:hypothetical protein
MVLGSRGLVGVKVAVVPVYVTTAGMTAAPFRSANVEPFRLVAVIGSLNVAVMGAFRGTSVAELAGTVDMTVGPF